MISSNLNIKPNSGAHGFGHISINEVAVHIRAVDDFCKSSCLFDINPKGRKPDIATKRVFGIDASADIDRAITPRGNDVLELNRVRVFHNPTYGAINSLKLLRRERYRLNRRCTKLHLRTRIGTARQGQSQHYHCRFFHANAPKLLKLYLRFGLKLSSLFVARLKPTHAALMTSEQG
jgi:hypothetical protein